MNTFLLGLQLLVADTSNVPYPYSLHRPTEKFEWKSVEVTVSKQYRDSIMQSFRISYNEAFKEDHLKSPEFEASFHFVHLNNDPHPDVIYDGWSSGEGDMVTVYINRQFTMEGVLQEFGNVIGLNFENKKLQTLIIYNIGCCAEMVEFERHFRMDDKFKFSLVRQRAIMEDLVSKDDADKKPDGFFPQPIQFRTINNAYALRYSAKISDEPILEGEGKGNIVGLYPANTKGIAWGYKKDATGREWWLVEMEPTKNISNSIYWNWKLEEAPTWHYGWMSSRFVERLP